ncbi:MAG: hypothetical protein MUF18_04620 [Fimbriiglobus sp.]|jgi:hypothetical protein|nr:hypothetical protein [Fimbriiglobus sp.]
MTLRQRLLLGGVGVMLAALALFVRPAPTTAAEQLTDDQFAKVRKAVMPADGEDDFAKIPWLTSIWDARIKAAKEGKPILLWEMDGHPLGCG